jgi:hypothetical protein
MLYLQLRGGRFQFDELRESAVGESAVGESAVVGENVSTEIPISARLGNSRDAPLRLAPSPPPQSY